MLHSSLYWKTNKKQVGGEVCFVVWFPLPLIIFYCLVFLFLWEMLVSLCVPGALWR